MFKRVSRTPYCNIYVVPVKPNRKQQLHRSMLFAHCLFNTSLLGLDITQQCGFPDLVVLVVLVIYIYIYIYPLKQSGGGGILCPSVHVSRLCPVDIF